MCLNTKFNLCTENDNDITVYKVFCYEIKDGRVILSSPYRYFLYTKKENIETLFQPHVKFVFADIGFHSFAELEAAEVLKNYFENISKAFDSKGDVSKYVVLKCKIPKNTPYFLGEFIHNAYINKKPEYAFPVSYCSKNFVIEDDSFIVDGVEYKILE
jgi:hypothetical protein